MRVAILNPVWNDAAATPAATLEEFPTLTGWADAVHAAGASSVLVWQRFHRDDEIVRDGVVYRFSAHAGPPRAPAWFGGGPKLIADLHAAAPDVIHINGLDHPQLVRRIRRVAATGAAVVVQDHGGFDPAALSYLRRRWMRRGLEYADVLLVATKPQADVFRAAAVVPERTAVRDVMETSTTFRKPPRTLGNNNTASGSLKLLWVGRLNANKDPLTVLDAFRAFVDAHDATLHMVYSEADLEREVRARVERDPLLRARVTLTGRVPHGQLESIYGGADVLVAGSHREGSGYAVLEALACGVVPVITDIPSFRGITDDGRLGALWQPGNAASCRAALERVAARPFDPQREACRTYFEANFSWRAIGARAMSIYRDFSRT